MSSVDIGPHLLPDCRTPYKNIRESAVKKANVYNALSLFSGVQHRLVRTPRLAQQANPKTFKREAAVGGSTRVLIVDDPRRDSAGGTTKPQHVVVADVTYAVFEMNFTMIPALACQFVFAHDNRDESRFLLRITFRSFRLQLSVVYTCRPTWFSLDRNVGNYM